MPQRSRVPLRPVVTSGVPRMRLAGVRLGIELQPPSVPTPAGQGQVPARPGLELGPVNEGVSFSGHHGGGGLYEVTSQVHLDRQQNPGQDGRARRHICMTNGFPGNLSASR